MDHDRPTEELLQRMLAAVVATFGGEEQIDRLIHGARAEAEAEVKDVIKAAIKATLLQRAVARLEGGTAVAEAAVDAPTDSLEQSVDPQRQTGRPASSGCYVYGITRARSPAPPEGLSGVDPRAPLRRVREGEVEALTSTISLDDFGPDVMAERVEDLGWIEEKVRAHDRVVKHLMDRGAVVPCRFGTVLRGEQDVRAVLARHAGGLAAALDAVDGKKEWGVKVSAPGRGGSPASEAASESGKDYFLQKKRDERARADAARAARAAADACHAELTAFAAGAIKLPTGDRGLGGRRGGDVLLNGAYLVPDAVTDSFHAIVNELAHRHEALGLSIEATGPWPPYNFVSLDLSLDGAAPPASGTPVLPEAAA